MKTIKALIAAAVISTAAIAGAAASANAAPLANLNAGIDTAIATNQDNGVTQAAFYRRHRCYRVPVYRWRWTPFGYRRVFVGFRRVCHRGFRRFGGYRRPGLRLFFSF